MNTIDAGIDNQVAKRAISNPSDELIRLITTVMNTGVSQVIPPNLMDQMEVEHFRSMQNAGLSPSSLRRY